MVWSGLFVPILGVNIDLDHGKVIIKDVLYITITCLYNFDPLKPHFYIVKLGFTGVYIIFLFLLKNIDYGYLIELPRRGSSSEYPQSMFQAELWKISEFLFEIFHFLLAKSSVYLDRHVFIMKLFVVLYLTVWWEYQSEQSVANNEPPSSMNNQGLLLPLEPDFNLINWMPISLTEGTDDLETIK